MIKTEFIQPVDLGKAWDFLLSDTVKYKKCKIEIINGKYKIYGVEHNTLMDAIHAVDERIMRFNAQQNLR